MADFSFLNQGPQPQQQQGGEQRPEGSGQQSRIQIPSFRDVQLANRPAAALNVFHAQSSTAAGRSSSSGPPPAGPVAALNPLAFVGGQGAPSGPALSAPPPQQQQQPAVWAPAQQPAAGAAPPHAALHWQHGLPLAPAPAGPPAYPPGAGAAPQAFHPNAIIVNRRQEGNPLLKHMRNVRWQFGDITADYMLGQGTAALFLSLRFHLLKPEYMHRRMKELQRAFRLRVLLCLVDTEDPVEPLAEVQKAAIGYGFALICAWSNAEAARYLETLKSYENKPAETIQKDIGTDYISRITAALTTVRGVNKTDVKTLGDRFGSVASIFQASAEELQACPGIGPTKARRLFDTFHEPFRKTVSGTAPVTQQQQQQRGPMVAGVVAPGPSVAAAAAAQPGGTGAAAMEGQAVCSLPREYDADEDFEEEYVD